MLTETPLTASPLPAEAAATALPLASDPRNPSLAAAAVDAAGPMIGRPEGDAWRDTFAFFRKLSAYLKPYKTRFIIGELAGIAFAFFNASIPLLMQAVLTHVGTAAHHSAKHVGSTKASSSLFGQGIGGFFNHVAESALRHPAHLLGRPGHHDPARPVRLREQTTSSPGSASRS